MLTVSKSSLAIPILIIVIGAGWLLSASAKELDTGLYWLWSIGLAVAGVAVMASRGVDKVSIVIGPFFLLAALLPPLWQGKDLSLDIELAGLVLANGVLMLLAKATAFPEPKRVEAGTSLRQRLHAVAVGISAAGLLVAGMGALAWLGNAMAMEGAADSTRFFGNIAVLGGMALAVVAALVVASLATRRPHGDSLTMLGEAPGVRARQLLIPILCAGLGAAWLIVGDIGTNSIIRLWSFALAGIGITAIFVAGVDKISVVLGPAYVLAGLVSVRRPIFESAGVPIIIVAIGILLLVAQAPAIREPGQPRVGRRRLNRVALGVAVAGLGVIGLGLLIRLGNAMMMEAGSQGVDLCGLVTVVAGILTAVIGCVVAVTGGSSGGKQVTMARSGRALPVWNSISAAAPFVGFVCGFAVGGATADRLRGEAIALGLGVWLAFAVLGLLAAAIAMVRDEKWWGLTLVAFLLNLALFAGLAATFWG